MPYLFLFQIGPVQSFIAAGRRTQDLYVGSRMLSELAKAGIEAVKGDPDFIPIFPMVQNGNLPEIVPHRFAFLISQEVHEVEHKVKEAIDKCWSQQFADPVREKLIELVGAGAWQTVYDRQCKNWREFYWVAVPYNPEEHSLSFKEANTALNQRKLLRDFSKIDEPGRKCTLTGSQSALNLDWQRIENRLRGRNSRDILFRPNENLGALVTIKRLARDSSFPVPHARSTRFIAGLTDKETDELDEPGRRQEGYIAVLHMDGDKMGKYLSNLQSLEEHQDFSTKLANFAGEVETIIKAHGGKTAQHVYAGGDDVLALLPLSHALSCAWELRQAFGRATEFKLTASAGIAITPYDYPLDSALQIARTAEGIAKDQYGRDAIVVTEAHGSGLIRHAGGKWDIIKLVEKLYQCFKAGILSGKLGYDLLTVASELVGQVPSGARLAEVTRLLRRRTAEGVDEEISKDIELLAQHFVYFGDADQHSEDLLQRNWENVAHWTILARFLAQPTRDEREGA